MRSPDDQPTLEAPGRRRLSLLQDIRVAAPCSASWEEMAGDDRVRFCGECEKNVYNLSGMTRDEAEDLLEQREGSICVRYYQREDGTVLTTDCPVGVRRRSRRRIAFGIAGAGLLASGAAMAALAPRQGAPAMPRRTEAAGQQQAVEQQNAPTPLPVTTAAPPPVEVLGAIPPNLPPPAPTATGAPAPRHHMGAAPPPARKQQQVVGEFF